MKSFRSEAGQAVSERRAGDLLAFERCQCGYISYMGWKHSVGVVTTLYDEDLPDVRQAFEYEAEFLAKRHVVRLVFEN